MHRSTAALALLLIGGEGSPALADHFDVSGISVVTHRGSNLTFIGGSKTKLDKGSELTCTSDNGCSIVIQVQLNRPTVKQVYPIYYLICTTIDDMQADPLCDQQLTEVNSGFLTSFQGKPALSKGLHVIKTTVSVSATMKIANYQIVYTLYQHA